jgi:hypothetical protein
MAVHARDRGLDGQAFASSRLEQRPSRSRDGAAGVVRVERAQPEAREADVELGHAPRVRKRDRHRSGADPGIPVSAAIRSVTAKYIPLKTATPSSTGSVAWIARKRSMTSSTVVGLLIVRLFSLDNLRPTN